ncbi:MAG: hypothetical protein JJU15_13370 [Pararhodobacter sp.]|nr:hypothetical protein [Pararhodobacter sp.]
MPLSFSRDCFSEQVQRIDIRQRAGRDNHAAVQWTACDDVAGFYTAWFDVLWDESGRSQDNWAIIRAVYVRWERPGGGVAESKPTRRMAGREKMAEVVFSAEELKGMI